MTNLMPDGFVVLAGSTALRAERASQDKHVRRNPVCPDLADSESLTRWQTTEGRKWSSVELTRSIYGWTVRATSGCDNFALLAGTRERGGPLDGSFKAALTWAWNWVEQDEPRRYAYTRDYDLNQDEAAVRLLATGR
jgi:hypothetical protein